jgi:hypothetical protein
MDIGMDTDIDIDIDIDKTLLHRNGPKEELWGKTNFKLLS